MMDDLKCSRQPAIIEIQEEYWLAITGRDSQTHAIQYENVNLQGEIRNARQTVIDLIENRHVLRMGKYGNVLSVLKNHVEDEPDQVGEHPYYLIKCQEKIVS